MALDSGEDKTMKHPLALVLSATLSLALLAPRAEAYGEGFGGRPLRTGRAARLVDGIKELPHTAREAAKSFGRFLKTRQGHAFIGAMVLAPLLIVQGYDAEVRRGHLIPMAFSELSRIKALAAELKIPESEMRMTLALAEGNEMSMKIIESWNEAHWGYRSGSEASSFAYELNNKWVNDTHQHKLPELLVSVPKRVEAALPLLATSSQLARAMGPLHGYAGQAWDYRPDHHYETVDDYGYDDDGKRVKTGEHDEYVDTTHRFYYHKDAGEKLAAGLGQSYATVPTFQLPERLQVTDKTHAEGEWAADRGKGYSDGSKRMSKEAQLANARSFANGSTYSVNLGTLKQVWNEALHNDTAKWSAQKASAGYWETTTTSKSHPGPEGYQTVERIGAEAGQVIANAREVEASLRHLAQAAPRLDGLIQDLIAIEVNHTKVGDSKKIATEIIGITRDTYAQTFKEGIDPKAMRAWVVSLWALGGLLGGGGLGYGVVPALNYLRRRE